VDHKKKKKKGYGVLAEEDELPDQLYPHVAAMLGEGEQGDV